MGGSTIGSGSDSRIWCKGPWQEGDSLGALRAISPESVVAALRLVQQGRIFDLGRVLENGMPVPPFHGQYFALMQYTLDNGEEWHHQNLGRMTNGYSAQNLRLDMCDHTGTHIDQLNHVGVKQEDGDFRLYGGRRNSHCVSSFGTTELGAEFMPPIVARGILADVADFASGRVLPEGYAISPEELRDSLRKEGVDTRPGDIVFVRTGWGLKWAEPNVQLAGEPGLGVRCADWAREHEILAWGIDQFGTDPVPYEVEGLALPMHIEMLVESGIRLMENVYLEELAEERVYEFCVIVSPLKIRGGTGSPVRPLAVV